MKHYFFPRRAGVRCAPEKQLLTILVASCALIALSMSSEAKTWIWGANGPDSLRFEASVRCSSTKSSSTPTTRAPLQTY